MIPEIQEANRAFVAAGRGAQYEASKIPAKGVAVVSCMDARLITLLTAALGLENGDANVITNAGGLVTGPCDSTMRSLLVSIYEMKVKTVMIVAHTDCGVCGMESGELFHLMRERGISEEALAAAQRDPEVVKMLTGFTETAQSVRDSMKIVREHPLVPDDVRVEGYILDTRTGELRPVN
ncbi:MAG: carbonic anhydrase [Bacteroidales bacterium]|nr:carbonic anhydrase [Bacteroidales bacterium]